MIRIGITLEAFDAITKTMPVSSVAVERQRDAKGDVQIWLDWLAVSKLRSLRGLGESYSDVILRLAEGERR